MHQIKVGMLALAAGFLFQGVAPQSVQAAPVGSAVHALDKSAGSGVIQVRRGGRHFAHAPRFHGPRAHGPRFHHHRHHYRRRHWRPGLYWGPTIGIYRGYGNSCYWLKRRAINTGSSYWWRRYNACRYGW
ncbi:MAG TPA: hypothetical protein PKD49_14885 [Hyphomicrobium sp.]|nr:hypothetical protein [Hyphomicrobium sp.]